ncbi:methyltransferase domain-containing protein [Angustibacter sp. McL0619]|uniref:methyltransferase domain-containing protein n=1 Tax=Angustibacter sp. McL0619 TaxID=3415676 RepID=UPI003CF9C357
MDRYVIRGGRAGADRLLVLARIWAATTSDLLDRCGVPSGARCLDLGCGAGDVTLELARRAGPGGRVTGVDRDAVKLEVARERALAAGCTNVDFEVLDVYDLSSRGVYDIAYCRNLLQHLSRPADVVRSMWQAVRRGGVIVVEDADFEGSFCHPPDAGFDFWVERYQSVLRSYGGDPRSGRKLAAYFAAAGIPRPQVSVVQGANLTGEAKSMPLLTVQATAQSMLGAGIATEQEIEDACTRLAALADDESTLIGSPRLVQVWSRRDDASS